LGRCCRTAVPAAADFVTRRLRKGAAPRAAGRRREALRWAGGGQRTRPACPGISGAHRSWALAVRRALRRARGGGCDTRSWPAAGRAGWGAVLYIVSLSVSNPPAVGVPLAHRHRTTGDRRRHAAAGMPTRRHGLSSGRHLAPACQAPATTGPRQAQTHCGGSVTSSSFSLSLRCPRTAAALSL
jgi:hypothetical protein